MEPCIKGSVVGAVVDDVRRLLEEGAISREALETQLEPADLEILDAKILATLWYPVPSYRRLTEVLLRVEGKGDLDYLRERGRRSASRLFDAGLYRQLNRGETIASDRRTAGELWSEQDGRLMATLAGVIFNFSTWTFTMLSADEGRYRVEADDAAHLPDVARIAAEGFIGYTASRLARTNFTVTSRREGEDRVVFSLERTPD